MTICCARCQILVMLGADLVECGSSEVTIMIVGEAPASSMSADKSSQQYKD